MYFEKSAITVKLYWASNFSQDQPQFHSYITTEKLLNSYNFYFKALCREKSTRNVISALNKLVCVYIVCWKNNKSSIITYTVSPPRYLGLGCSQALISAWLGFWREFCTWKELQHWVMVPRILFQALTFCMTPAFCLAHPTARALCSRDKDHIFSGPLRTPGTPGKCQINSQKPLYSEPPICATWFP